MNTVLSAFMLLLLFRSFLFSPLLFDVTFLLSEEAHSQKIPYQITSSFVFFFLFSLIFVYESFNFSFYFPFFPSLLSLPEKIKEYHHLHLFKCVTNKICSRQPGASVSERGRNLNFESQFPSSTFSGRIRPSPSNPNSPSPPLNPAMKALSTYREMVFRPRRRG